MTRSQTREIKILLAAMQRDLQELRAAVLTPKGWYEAEAREADAFRAAASLARMKASREGGTIADHIESACKAVGASYTPGDVTRRGHALKIL